MALATKCPHCNTIFRVAADQLKLRGGIVRCGSCALVFDGNAALVEPAPKPTPVIPDVVAETPPAKPAISEYVHGSPVDFEIDFDEAPAAAPAAKPAEPAPAAAPPAVWRTASTPEAGTPSVATNAASAPAAPQPAAPAPTPDDIAIAAVARAFAAATTHPPVAAPAAPQPGAASRATTPAPAEQQANAMPPRAAEPPPVAASVAARPAAPAPSSRATRSLLDVVSPDASFTAAAEPSPPLVPDHVATDTAPAQARPAAGPSSLADLVAPDAIFAATAEESPPLAPPPAAKAPSPAGPAPLPDVLSPDATFSAATETTPVAAAPAVPLAPVAESLPEAPQEVEAPSPAIETPQQQDDAPAEPVPAAEEVPAWEAPTPIVDTDLAADVEVPPAQASLPELDETAAEPAHVAEDITLAPEPAPDFEAPMPVEHAVSPADAEVPPVQDTEEHALPPPQDEIPVEAAESAQGDEEHAAEAPGEQAGASLLEALDQWSTDSAHPDGRVEPSLDTPQEHLVVAVLDDAHHLEDLPPDEQPEPVAPAAEAEAQAASEPWSLSEPDETALHAVAAVNTDAPDDGASVTDEEPVEQPKSRRERALKRAKSRRDASGPAAEHEVFAPEENGPPQESSAEEVAARMRAIAGVADDGATAAEDLDHSDLSFVKRVDRSQRYGKALTITMAVGVPILLAGLVLQAATTFRDTLAANYPQLKPALAAVCQPLGCKIALPTQLDALSVEPGELASMTENTFSFSTVLRNQSKTPQAWPHVELTLNDNADKPVLRRVFAPHEYLPSPNEAEKGFGPRSEQSIKLYFELKELKASGYHIAIFYP